MLFGNGVGYVGGLDEYFHAEHDELHVSDGLKLHGVGDVLFAVEDDMWHKEESRLNDRNVISLINNQQNRRLCLNTGNFLKRASFRNISMNIKANLLFDRQHKLKIIRAISNENMI